MLVFKYINQYKYIALEVMGVDGISLQLPIKEYISPES